MKRQERGRGGRTSILIRAALQCPKHPQYKAVRQPSVFPWRAGCLCRPIWQAVQAVRLHSKDYEIKWRRAR